MEASKSLLALIPFPSTFYSVWTEQEALKMRQKRYLSGCLNPVLCQLYQFYASYTNSASYPSYNRSTSYTSYTNIW